MQTIKRLDLADAEALIAGARAHAGALGVPMCVSVVDEAGHTIAFQRMDGAKVLSVRLADDKAFTAAVSRRPTHEYNELCIPGELTFGIHTSSGGRFSTVGGGFPVLQGRAVVGGIGCSDGAATEDMACAEAGIRHWRNKLKQKRKR